MNNLLNWRRASLRTMTVFLMLLSFSACGKSEPTYSGISVEGFNYLPYNLSRFTVDDAFGNSAHGGGDDTPGNGEGSLSCCYALKGTEFKVKWDYYDADQWQAGNKQLLHAETTVSLPPSPTPRSTGNRILEVHFYPDHHVELVFPGALLGSTRISVSDVTRWMFDHYHKQLDERYAERDDQQFRRIAREVAVAWLKYKLTDTSDLEQYFYYSLIVNDHFDAHPDVQKILQSTEAQPGKFAAAMSGLPQKTVLALKQNKFQPVAVPSVPVALLPAPR